MARRANSKNEQTSIWKNHHQINACLPHEKSIHHQAGRNQNNETMEEESEQDYPRVQQCFCDISRQGHTKHYVYADDTAKAATSKKADKAGNTFNMESKNWKKQIKKQKIDINWKKIQTRQTKESFNNRKKTKQVEERDKIPSSRQRQETNMEDYSEENRNKN